MRKTLIFLIVAITLFFVSCNDSQDTYDLRLLNNGDIWVGKINPCQELSHCYVYKDRLYGSTTNITYGEFLYCLNLKSGKVNWRVNVDAFATQPVTEFHDTVFYCSYLGQMYAFDLKGNQLWKNKFSNAYAYHWVDTVASIIYFNTVSGDKTSKYDLTGKLIKESENNSEKWKITNNSKKVPSIKKKYIIKNNGWNYLITVTTSKDQKSHELNITTYR